MDVLSEVLKVVKLQGAVYFNAEFSAPWSIFSPHSCKLSPYLAAGAEHMIIYHLVTHGRATLRTEDGESISLEPGDVVVSTYGEQHFLGNGSAANPIDNSDDLANVFKHGLKLWRFGGGGEVTKFVCGFMACDPRMCQMFLGGLPRFFKVNIRGDASGRWLEDSIRFSVDEIDACRPGGEAVLAKLSEVLFVETLRNYITQLSPEETGWLAGARDGHVGKALTLMHREPARPWTIAGLAKAAGVSRSVLAERFRHYLKEPPMTYLTRWRLHLGAQTLTTTSHSVAQVAAEVGYESEAAFNRAFKREFEMPPARFRNRAKAVRLKPAAGKKLARAARAAG